MKTRNALTAATLAIVAALTLAACGDTTEAESEPEPATTEAAAPTESTEPSPEALAWQEGRPPALKQIIDEDTAAKNCDGLQATFDTWADADDPTNTSAELLSYIDNGLQEAGCY
jgi:hypothetical protein